MDERRDPQVSIDLNTVVYCNLPSDNGVHVVYKREALVPTPDFCGIDSVITEEQLIEDETAIFEDVFVTGQKLTAQSDLIVRLPYPHPQLSIFAGGIGRIRG